ncbi:beta strand repeat-containing protein [Polaromonas sp.]|uniref:beta strand repeat-containing protein n=1 Tax=Polaromonas sp. TaxID=1869339 RepID=UPI002FCBAE2B
MYAILMSPAPLRPERLFTHWIVGLFAALVLALAGFAAHAAPPPSGTSISNQASATYSDASGVSRTVTSNVVQTTVQQVASLTLAANGAQNATPGSVVYYPHTLTNTGNGSDGFNLATGNAGGFTMAGVQIFADNGSGQPTGAPITSTGSLAAGAVFKFIVAGTLPGTATAGQTNAITVTATSLFDATKTTTNTDTTTVSNNAVITLTKAVSASSGAPGSGPYTYTLTYTNTGNSTATAVVISDIVPAGMTYVAGSARWSVTGAAALSDSGGSSGSAPNTLTSQYTAGTTTYRATLNQVAPGQSGTISFNVNIGAATAPGTLNNTATTSYNNGAATVTGSSNTVPFAVQQTAAVTITGQTVAGPATPGSTVSFTNVVTNAGNGVDTFNITTSGSGFPAGTTFQLYKSDSVTPLVDTNSDGTVDTGPLAAGATYSVILKATLPPSATNAGAPFSVTKTATSVFDPTKTASTTDTLSAIASASADLTNNAPLPTATAAQGAGAGPEATARVTNAVNPGAATSFTLVANNTGPSPDSYNLGASTVSSFASQVLPAGWTVSFKADGGAGNCSTTGATITNTGSVAAGGSVTVCAVVTVPAGYTAGTNDVYFRILSPTSNASDTIHDAVTVNAVRAISITPNGAGQTYSGGSYVYSHTLVNTGNVSEGNGTASTVVLAAANNQASWTSTLYYDANNNGVLDATDPQITGNLNTVTGLSGGLASGQSITVFDKVISPSGAVPGAVNATTITITTTNGSYVSAAPAPAVATDSTTVIAGNLNLIKAQALDTACAGPTGGTTYSTANLSAKPGECVLYQVTITNVGSADATSVVVSDSTPSYTTLSSAPATTVGTIGAGAPAVGATGTVTANIGTLTPGQLAVLTFGVKINQ